MWGVRGTQLHADFPTILQWKGLTTLHGDCIFTCFYKKFDVYPLIHYISCLDKICFSNIHQNIESMTFSKYCNLEKHVVYSPADIDFL